MALRFVGGDDVVEPFLLRHTDGTIVNLTHMRPLTGGVWWKGRPRIALTVGAGITVNSQFPPEAGIGGVQEPHGFTTLVGDSALILDAGTSWTRLIPFGEIASIRLVAISLIDGLVMSTYLMPLERVT